MTISIRRTGGILGGSEEVVVEEDKLKATDRHGSIEVPLDAARTERLSELSAQLLADNEVVPSGDPDVVDAQTTVIDIDHGGKRVSLEIRSGDQAPDAVWELVDEVHGYVAAQRKQA